MEKSNKRINKKKKNKIETIVISIDHNREMNQWREWKQRRNNNQREESNQQEVARKKGSTENVQVWRSM